MKYLPLVVEFHAPSTREAASAWFEDFTRSRMGARPYSYRSATGEVQASFSLPASDGRFQVMGGGDGGETWHQAHVQAKGADAYILELEKWPGGRNQEVRASLATGLRAIQLLPGMLLLVAQDLFPLLTAAAPPRTKRTFLWLGPDKPTPAQAPGVVEPIRLLSGQAAFAY